MIFTIFSDLNISEIERSAKYIFDCNEQLTYHYLPQRTCCVTFASKYFIESFDFKYNNNQWFCSGQHSTKQIAFKLEERKINNALNNWFNLVETLDFKTYWKEFLEFHSIDLKTMNIIICCLSLKEVEFFKTISDSDVVNIGCTKYSNMTKVPETYFDYCSTMGFTNFIKLNCY